MNAKDRKKAYKEYLDLLDKSRGLMSPEVSSKLAEAFNVTEEDINQRISDIQKSYINKDSVDVLSAHNMLLMEDLRDYRDFNHIMSSRADIIRDMYSTQERKQNTDYIFLA